MMFRAIPTTLALATLLSAQAAPPQGLDPTRPQGAVASITDLRAPIRVEEYGSRKEVWASGPDYKVSFHDGFVYYPVLGKEAPKNLPLGWRTVSVTAGGRPLLNDTGSSRPTFTDSRCEYRHFAVTEAYDVRDDGVEQTFTISDRPSQRGDVVVTGRVMTELSARFRPRSHAPITFANSRGQDILEYGAAFAIDAGGERVNLETAFDDGRISITVPEAWLEGATFPIVIDPLVSTKIAVPFRQIILAPDLARESESTHSNVMVTFLRAVSSADNDSWAYLMNDDFSARAVVHTRTGTPRVRSVEAVYVGSADRWVVGTEEYSGTTRRHSIASYFHDRANRGYKTGRSIVVPLNPGTTNLMSIGLGGCRSGNRALLFQVARTSSHYTFYSYFLDARNRRLERTQYMWKLNARMGEWPGKPSLSTASDDADGWLISWVYAGNGTNRYYVHGLRTRFPGTLLGGIKTLWTNTSSDVAFGRSIVRGTGGTYLVAFRVHRSKIFWRRVNWKYGSTLTQGLIRTRNHRRIANFTDDSHDLSFDTDTRNHWVLAFKEKIGTSYFVRLIRVGHTGAEVERRLIAASSALARPALAFNDDAKSFLVAFNGTLGPTSGILGTALVHDVNTSLRAYGTGCGNAFTTAEPPYAGRGQWEVRLLLGAPNSTAFFVLSGRPATVALSGGCYANVDMSVAVVVSRTLDRVGSSRMRLLLPDDPVFLGSVYIQWAYESGGQLLTTKGTHVRVGH